jgi:hypothetical protein
MLESLLTSDGTQTRVRPAVVAGAFYPADEKSLRGMMDQMLAQLPAAAAAAPDVALVAPHAGYIYSGPVAAYAYQTLAGRSFQRVVVIAPSHAEAFSYSSIYDGDAYSTPLGQIAIDRDFARMLAASHTSIRLSSHGHMPTPQGAEHAVEVQLPWLQRMLGSFTLVPIVMGDASYAASRALGMALAAHCGAETLIVASSDLSHYHPYDEAVRMDHQTLDAIAAWDYFSLARNIESRQWEACGGAPIVAAMIAARRLGANHSQVLRYANSGDTAGPRDRVVGYGAVALTHSPQADAGQETFTLSDADKAALLALARSAVETAVRERRTVEPATSQSAALLAERGAFTTLHRHGQLRGCIGFTAPRKSLAETIRDTAILAALRDPRFAPVQTAELADLEYEISVLSPLTPVLDPHTIRVGEDGLLIKQGEREGLLLPQVPVEWKWDREKFLQQTCHKAGLPNDAWKDAETDIFSFTAVVFGEKKPVH